MNGSAIVAAVRTATMIPTSQVTDQEALGWINEGYFRVAASRPWPWLEAADHIDTVAAQQAYVLSTDLATDWRRIVAVYDDDNKTRLRQWDAASAVDYYGDVFPSSSRATGFFLWAGSLYFIPIPSTVKIYKVLYHKTPTALTTATAPDFDPMFHPLLVHYGEFRAWQREEDLDKAATAYAHFQDMANSMGRWYTDRVDDSPWRIGVPQGGGWLTNTPFLDGL